MPDPHTIIDAAKLAAATGPEPKVATTTGIYSVIIQLATFLVVFSGAVTAWIKYGPNWQEAANKRRQIDDARQDAEVIKLMARIDSLENKMLAADERAKRADQRTHVVQLQVVTMSTAFRMVTGELQRLDPTNAVLQQANDLVAVGMAEDSGVNAGYMRIASLFAENDTGE